MYHADASLAPVSKLTLTGCTWVSVLVCALLRGGKGGASWLEAPCGGGVYWGVFGLNLALLFAATVYARDLVLTRYDICLMVLRQLAIEKVKGNQVGWRFGQ